MDYIMGLLGLSSTQASAAIAGVIAVMVFKGLELALQALKKLAGKTSTPVDDALVDAIADAVHAKLK